LTRPEARAPETKAPAASAQAAAVFKSTFGFEAREFVPLRAVKHSITRYRITLEAFSVALEKIPKSANLMAGEWKTPAQMRTLAFTAAHKKLASAATQSILSGR
jgi:O-glycosyl hydrolase